MSLSTISVQHVPVLQWPSSLSKARGVVIIVHGMMEHSLRYKRLISHLNESGFHVISFDLPGHGSLAYTNGLLGQLKLWNGSRQIMTDTHSAMNYVSDYYPGLPVILFGHSFGSFISRLYASQCPTPISGLILSGTTIDRSLMPVIGRLIATVLSVFGRSKKPSKLLNKLAFLGFKHNFEWLSSDPKVVETYKSDPMCGFTCSNGFFAAVFKLLRESSTYSTLRKIPESLPILLISGSEDQLSKNGKRVAQLNNDLLKLKKNVQTNIIDGERHEVFMGSQQQSAFDTVTEFCLSCIQKQ